GREVEGAEHRVVTLAAQESQYPFADRDQFYRALRQHRVFPPEGERFPVAGKDGTGIAVLYVHRAGAMLAGHRQPWPAGREAGILHVRLPHHGRAAAVAALVAGPETDAVRI